MDARSRTRSLLIALGAFLVLAIGGALGPKWGRASRPIARASGAAPATVELHVPHMRGSIVLDGDMDDPGWAKDVARTADFTDGEGKPTRPYSDARFVWGEGYLYVALYAADEDIRASHTERDAPVWLEDSFHLLFRRGQEERMIDVSPLGTITDARRASPEGRFDYAWNGDVHVSREVDGTLNDPSDDDEEWVIEMAIPFEALGLDGKPGERVDASIRRCDVLHSGVRSCGTWASEASPAVLVLD